ncbi:uncharacterized protein OCT59_021215 [Rhizophagus irregularis]|uniref:uncharacterized protein n=1 Tax=Rhizophagus irregularis TaxID=588596 RepID=UPI00331D873F|nr:hypothetical protein OCT59_021215 [Rhizophagus irregularis]
MNSSGPRDGLTPDEFYEICDNQSFTVTAVTKVKNSNEILGGYNPISCRVKDPKFAIVNSTFYGPTFGNGDFILRGNNFYNSSYCRNILMKEQLEKLKEHFR